MTMFVRLLNLSQRMRDIPKPDLERCGLVRSGKVGKAVCEECGWSFPAGNTLLHANMIHHQDNPQCSLAHELMECYRFFVDVSGVSDILMRETYANWPHRLPDVDAMVAAGFYHTGLLDNVACKACGVQLFEWCDDDDPMEEHRKASPDCVIVRGRILQ